MQFTYDATHKRLKICWQDSEGLQLNPYVTIICSAPCKIQGLLKAGKPITFFPKHIGQRMML